MCVIVTFSPCLSSLVQPPAYDDIFTGPQSSAPPTPTPQPSYVDTFPSPRESRVVRQGNYYRDDRNLWEKLHECFEMSGLCREYPTGVYVTIDKIQQLAGKIEGRKTLQPAFIFFKTVFYLPHPISIIYMIIFQLPATSYSFTTADLAGGPRLFYLLHHLW